MTRWYAIWSALYLAVASCASPDIAGSGPSNNDIVDPGEMNIYQTRASGSSPGVRTQHPACVDARCVDLYFRDAVCADTFTVRDLC